MASLGARAPDAPRVGRRSLSTVSILLNIAGHSDRTVAGVAGIPYKACKHVGVISVAHDAGTALEVTLVLTTVPEIFTGAEMTGRPWYGSSKETVG